MTKFWVMSEILGTGGPPPDGFRAAHQEVDGLIFEFGPIIETGGVLAEQYTIALVGSRDRARVRAKAGVTILPDVGYSAAIQSVAQTERDALVAEMARLGADLSSNGLTVQSSVGELINALGQRLDATFDAEAFDIVEASIPQAFP